MAFEDISRESRISKVVLYMIPNSGTEDKEKARTYGQFNRRSAVCMHVCLSVCLSVCLHD